MTNALAADIVRWPARTMRVPSTGKPLQARIPLCLNGVSLKWKDVRAACRRNAPSVINRIDRGMAVGLVPGVDAEATPACVVACPTGARAFGDLNDPNSNVSQILRKHPSYRLRENLGTGPRVYYLAVGEEGIVEG